MMESIFLFKFVYKILVTLPRPRRRNVFFPKRDTHFSAPPFAPKKDEEFRCSVMAQHTADHGDELVQFDDEENDDWNFNWKMDSNKMEVYEKNPNGTNKRNPLFHTITYCLVKDSKDIVDDTKEYRAVNFAIETWNLEITWQLKRVKWDQDPDIEILFVEDDQYLERSGALAITQISSKLNDGIKKTKGTIKFNEKFDWSLDGEPEIDNSTGGLKTSFNMSHTLLHEIGHGLGLVHSDKNNSIMYQNYNAKLELSNNDVENIRDVYGHRNWQNSRLYENAKKVVKRGLKNPDFFSNIR